jgi:sugar-specific transcriptional regulator TrmB
MGAERVVEQLQDLGMSGYEAKAYVALVAGGAPLNGYEVAKSSGVPRSTVYETLAKLVARGAAYEVRGNEGSTEYLPLPPASLLSRMRRSFDDSFTALERSLPEVAVPAASHLIHNLTGRDAILLRAIDVVVNARTELFVSSWPEELVDIKVTVREAERRGVDVSVMSFGPDDEPVSRTYTHQFSRPEVVLQNLGCRLFVVAADRREVLIGGFANGDAWGVYADDPAVVLVAVEYVRHDIAMQLLAERLGPERVEEFWTTDPELVRLRSDNGLPAAALRAGGSAAALLELGRRPAANPAAGRKSSRRAAKP